MKEEKNKQLKTVTVRIPLGKVLQHKSLLAKLGITLRKDYEDHVDDVAKKNKTNRN